MSTVILWLVYLGCALGIGAGARFVRRPIPLRVFVLFAILPVAFLFRGFVSDTTPIPVEDVRLLTPWTSLPPPFGTPEPTRNPNLNDIALQIAPWTKAVRLAWKSGELPWLDRWNGCGTPLAANAQSAAFSPLTIVGLALPLARSFTLAAAVKLLLALSGMWLWLLELRVSRSAALVGSVGFGFSLLMTVWLPWPITAVVCLWPWALFLVERLADERARGRSIAALTAVLVFWALGGHPESAAVGAGFVGAWMLFRFCSGAWANRGAVLRSVIAAAAIAIGLSAVLLVPQVEAIRGSNRRANAGRMSAAVAASWKPHPPRWKAGFVTPFFPKAYGDAILAPMLPSASYSFPEIGSAYPGAVIWVLVLLVARPGGKRRREVWGLAAIALLGTAAATWTWPVVEMLVRVPGLAVMLPVRFHAWIPLCAVPIAAFELDRLRADLARSPRQALWLTGAAALFALAGFAVFLHLRPAYRALGGYRQEAKTFLLLGAALAVAGAAGAAAARKSKSAAARDALLSGVLAAAALGELFALARPLDRLGRSDMIFPDTPLVTFLRSRPRPFRVVGLGPAMFPNANVFSEVEDIRTHDPMERRDYVAFLDAALGYPPEQYFKFVGNPDAAALDFLNVAYAIAPPGTAPPGIRWHVAYSGPDGLVFQNGCALPRVFAPSTVRLASSRGDRNADDAFVAFGLAPDALVSGIDWHREAIVLSQDGALPIPAPAAAAPVISGIRETTNRLLFSASVPGNSPRLVVASEVQDGGWRARDEEGPLPTGRANGPFLAIALRPGNHRVVLTYAPPGLRTGGAVAAVTAALVAIFARRRRARGARRGFSPAVRRS